MQIFGFLVVDKPLNMTSHDVVAKVRRGIQFKRIGHAGTLDPLATGALILCIGSATRLSDYVMNSRKVYLATARLGIETTTYDREGEIVATHSIDHLTRADLDSALGHFQGEVDQIPPMHSAIKQDGKKLYELARQGKEVERAARRVWMQTQVLNFAPPDLELEITCSAGTYIRSIAHDLGAILGVGAHLIALRRVQSGSAHDLVDWDVLNTAMAAGTWQQYLRSERDLLAHIPALDLTAAQTDDVLHGRRITAPTIEENSENPTTIYRAYDPDGHFIAILESEQTLLHPIKVLVEREE